MTHQVTSMYSTVATLIGDIRILNLNRCLRLFCIGTEIVLISVKGNGYLTTAVPDSIMFDTIEIIYLGNYDAMVLPSSQTDIFTCLLQLL